jgi:hypothetical protein
MTNKTKNSVLTTLAASSFLGRQESIAEILPSMTSSQRILLQCFMSTHPGETFLLQLIRIPLRGIHLWLLMGTDSVSFDVQPGEIPMEAREDFTSRGGNSLNLNAPGNFKDG